VWGKEGRDRSAVKSGTNLLTFVTLAAVRMVWFEPYYIFVQPCIKRSFRREVWYTQPS